MAVTRLFFVFDFSCDFAWSDNCSVMPVFCSSDFGCLTCSVLIDFSCACFIINFVVSFVVYCLTLKTIT